MEIKINIAKKHFWAIMTVIVLLSATVFVFATGYVDTMASHATLFADTIRGKSGASVTVDDGLTVTNGIISGDGSGITNIKMQLSCISTRSGSLDDDAVAWCPDTHPTMSHCAIADDQAPATTPTDLSICPSNGLCDASNNAQPGYVRTGLGSDHAYLELVQKGPVGSKVQGCWQYDDGHSRTSYKLELVCCK